MKAVIRAAVLSLLGVSACLVVAVTAASGGTGASSDAVGPFVVFGSTFPSDQAPPPTAQDCIDGSEGEFACYAPQDLRNEYDFTGAYARGWTGAGQTIVIFDSYGTPTIKRDLATFDEAYGIPEPPSFQIYEPEGQVTYHLGQLPDPVYMHNKQVDGQFGWMLETTLDVEWAHAMAPGANIALVVIPVSETSGVQGLQNMQNAQQWALDHHIGNIWSDSWGAVEQSFQPSVLQQFDRLYAQAAAQGVNVFFGDGDSGVFNCDRHGTCPPHPTVNYPASSPNVISVGGTEIPTPVPAITSYQPEQVWDGDHGATGGGYSSVFARPPFQNGTVTGSQRGVPDVAYDSAFVSNFTIYESYNPFYVGWNVVWGTSAAAPQWAAASAIAQQAKGSPLGQLEPQLYALRGTPAFHDITVGNNSFAGITGYDATPGWDPTTGLGTPDVAALANDLSH
jgi:subtilase family serine protease